MLLTQMEAPRAHCKLSPEVWKEIFARLPMMWRAICCRVCKVWQEDLEQPQQRQGGDTLVDHGLATLCSVLAAGGVDEVMRRMIRHYPCGIAPDLRRMDQVRRFLRRHEQELASVDDKREPASVDEWIQLASQEPDAGWLCKAASRTKLEGRGKCLIKQVVGKPQEFSKLLDRLRRSGDVQSGDVRSVAFSPDQKYVTTRGGEKDNSVRIWKVATGREVCSLKGHSSEVNCVAYSPDGKRIASGSDDNTVIIWDAVTMEEVGTLRGHWGCVLSVAYSPDGSQLASTCDYRDNTVRLWDPTTMEHKGTLKGHSMDNPQCTCRHYRSENDNEDWKVCANVYCTMKGHSDVVRCVACSPDGKRIASASDDNTVKIWDGVTMKEVWSLTGHSGRVLSVAWSPDSEMIASGGEDNTVLLWSKLGKHKGTLKGHTKDNPECTCRYDKRYSGSYAYEANHSCPVKGHCAFVRCVAYSPDGKRIASSSDTDTVKIWDAVTLKEVCSLRGHSKDNPECTCAHFYLELYESRDYTANPLCPVTGHSKSVLSVAYSPDGSQLASSGGDKIVRLWDPKTMEHKGILRGHSAPVLSVAYSPDGSQLASAGDRGDNTVRLWDPTTMEHKGTLTGTIASWQNLDSETKKLAAKVKQGESACANRMGQYIVTASRGMVYVYKTNSEGEKQGKALACFRSPSTVTSVTCREALVVAGCSDGQVLFLEAPLLGQG